MKPVSPSSLLTSSRLLLDVRSPSEFAQGHIPEAHSLPLFSDEERAEVGTLYKQTGRAASVRRGLSIVGPKMAELVDSVDALMQGREKQLLVHCWRGGMRSASVGWLLETAGYDVEIAEGGYKAWRQFMSRYFEQPWSIKILTGHTGSAKTEVLKEMGKQGAQIIDLEGLAHHRGSSFGALGQAAQPSTEHFHNLVAVALSRIDPMQPLWLEDESIHIGKCHLPESLFAQMRQAPWVRLELPRSRRIAHIVELYGQADRAKLEMATKRIGKRLGGQRLHHALERLHENDLAGCTEHLLHYYDKAYDRSIHQRDQNKGKTVSFTDERWSTIAKHLLTL